MSGLALVTRLRDAGLTVHVYGSGLTKGRTWRKGKPIGVMHHHTASPVPYPVSSLAGDRDGLIKCNLNTKPNGEVYLVAYNACNYSSGKGSSVVFKETLADKAPAANAIDRGLHDDMYGNSYYFNFENDHRGTGGGIPAVQHNAIVLATQVVLDFYDLVPANVISHAEWTARKVDPYWNNNRRAIEVIRGDVSGTPTPPPPPPSTDWTKELIMGLPTLRKGDGFKAQNPQLRQDVRNLQGLLLANGHKDENTSDPETAADGLFGSGTDAGVRGFQAENHLSVDGVVGQKTWTTLLGQ